jgi:small subunit ribosomal protein S6
MKTRDYEAMFLLDNDAATTDFDGTTAKVDGLIERAGGKIVKKEKWDERKLAYEIRGHRRATYYLVYFTAPATTVAELNRDAELSEQILRHLVIGLDEPIATHIELRAAERERLAEESRKASLAAGWGERRGRREGEGEGEDEMIEVPAEARAVEE